MHSTQSAHMRSNNEISRTHDRRFHCYYLYILVDPVPTLGKDKNRTVACRKKSDVIVVVW